MGFIATPCLAELPKEKFEACKTYPNPSDALNCMESLSQDEIPTAPASKDLAALITDCETKMGPCIFVWSDIEVTFSSNQAWFKVHERFAPGSEAIQWSIACNRDRMTDKKLCTLSPGDYGEGIYINYKGDGRHLRVDTKENAFPLSYQTIRVDKNPASSAPASKLFTVQATDSLIDEMKNGTTVSTRYFDWPEDHSQDAEFQLRGFKSIITLSDAFAKHYR